MNAVCEIDDVAKKAAKSGRPPSDRGPRDPVLTIKAYPEWTDWLNEFRAVCAAKGYLTTDNAKMVDLAFRALAEKEKFRMPPER